MLALSSLKKKDKSKRAVKKIKVEATRDVFCLG
jgi:hypothetical protein